MRTPAEIAVYEAAYYAANKDYIAARHAAYRAANKDHIAASEAAYRAANKGKIAAYQAAEVMNLSDVYVRGSIARQSGIRRKDIPAGLIEVKRLHLKIKRTLKGS